MQVRWRTCPFPRIADALPISGRILEVGCGHGLFSAYLALAATDRHVVGVDIDRAKVDIGRRVASRVSDRGGDLSIVAVEPDRLPDGAWDAIAVVDVLYLLSEDAQERLVKDLAGRLSPGGVLAIKEMAAAPAWKLAIARLQEFVSVRLLRITEGDELVFLPPQTVARWMQESGLDVEERRLDQRRPHPHHLVLGRAT